MKKKIFYGGGIFLLILVLLLGYCWGVKCPSTALINSWGRSPAIVYPNIHFGYEPWPGFLIVPLADKLGYFKDEGITVTYSLYTDFEKLVADTLSGVVTARAAFSSEIVYEARKSGIHTYITLVTDHSLGADALLTRKGAPNLADVKGNKIANVGPPDFFSEWALKSVGRTINDYEFVNSDSEEQSLEMLSEGKVDHIITYEPYVSKAEQMGARVEYSSDLSPGVITDVIAINKDYILRYPEAVNAFVRAYFKAYAYWKMNPKLAYDLVVPIFGIPRADFEKQMQKIGMLGEQENKATMQIFSGLGSIYGNLRLINIFANKHDGEMEFNPDDLVYPNAIRKLD